MVEEENILEGFTPGKKADVSGPEGAADTATEATPGAASETPQELPPEHQYCVFRAGRERYCISVLAVEEVVEWPKITLIPLAPSYLLGIFNLRGAIVPVVDVAFGQGKRAESPLKRVVVGMLPATESHGAARIGIAADEVMGTFTTIEPLATEGLPEHLPHCCGLLREGDKLAMALDLQRIWEIFPVPMI